MTPMGLKTRLVNSLLHHMHFRASGKTEVYLHVFSNFNNLLHVHGKYQTFCGKLQVQCTVLSDFSPKIATWLTTFENQTTLITCIINTSEAGIRLNGDVCTDSHYVDWKGLFCNDNYCNELIFRRILSWLGPRNSSCRRHWQCWRVWGVSSGNIYAMLKPSRIANLTFLS